MAIANFELTITTPQFVGPTVEQLEAHGRNWAAWTRDVMFQPPLAEFDDFGDERIFIAHDEARAGETGLSYEQSARGPLVIYISNEVSDGVLAKMAQRHSLDLDELRDFRDGFDHDFILATRVH